MFILLMCFAAIRGMTVTGDSWKRKWGIYSAEHKSYCFLFQGTSRYQRLVWGGGLRGITDVIVIHTTRALCLCRSLLAPVSLFPQKWEDRGCCLLFLKTPLPTRRVLAVKGPCRAPSSAPPAQPSGTRAPRRCVWPGQLPGPRHAGALCSGWWEAEPCVWVLPPPTEGNQYAWVGGLSAEMPRHSYTALAVGSALAALILFWFVGGGEGGKRGEEESILCGWRVTLPLAFLFDMLLFLGCFGLICPCSWWCGSCTSNGRLSSAVSEALPCWGCSLSFSPSITYGV